MKKFLILTALLFFPVIAFAQSIPVPLLPNTTPSDVVQDIPGGVPSAQNKYVTIGTIAGVPNYVYNVPLTGFSLTFGNSQVWEILNPAGTLATGTLTFAPNPSDGQRECVVSSQAQTAITFTANTGQTVVGAPSALVAGTAVCFAYVLPIATWFKA
jgi:hypothetical protein